MVSAPYQHSPGGFTKERILPEVECKHVVLTYGLSIRGEPFKFPASALLWEDSPLRHVLPLRGVNLRVFSI